MKKFLVILITLVFCSFASADFTVTVTTNATWNGYMNCFNLSMGDPWGSGWGTSDLRANFVGSNPELYLQSNINAWNASDPYWVVGGVGQRIMEANFYQEFTGKDGETLTFNFIVHSNNLAASGYTTLGFVKVLDSGSGWATVQATNVSLTSGSFSLSLTEDGTSVTPVMQAGFQVMGVVCDPASSVASQGAFIDVIPEPVTIGVFLGAFLFLRKKFFA